VPRSSTASIPPGDDLAKPVVKGNGKTSVAFGDSIKRTSNGTTNAGTGARSSSNGEPQLEPGTVILPNNDDGLRVLNILESIARSLNL